MEGRSEVDPVAQIVAAQERGDHRHALSLFEENGGIYFIHYHGTDACLEVLNRFPRRWWAPRRR